MNEPTRKRTLYTRPERISDAAVHVIGTALALMAVPVLITLTATRAPGPHAIAGIAIYGAALIACMGCSAAYNMLSVPGWNGVLRRLDHSAIYIKIAGTFTAFIMLAGTGIWLIVALWAAALTGVVLKVVAPHRFEWFGFGLYIAMGWVGVGLGWPIFAQMSGPVLALVCLGGLTYTTGTLFYLRHMMPFHRTIWHVFVLVASGTFYAAVTVQMVQSTG
ncbi:PAQR family membrane homeostasis protein TrhA [Falsirhodobacter xinxiangensis]|uniref:PAQR family membrane homeostasis protein TrhA n=1 Tax=Falsirhodobacter xinxiangensis TaxID=2530049 RepID=UPI0010AB0B9A|nr:hemolysin III family protein [Rhodobacter xinxiangensis]